MSAQLFAKIDGAYVPAKGLALVKQNGSYEAVPVPGIKVKAGGEYVGDTVPPAPPTAFSDGFSTGFL
jgi:hypothetical protein